MVASKPVPESSKLSVTLGTHGHSDHRNLIVSHGKLKSAVTITFQRTLRVPDNKQVNNLPPSLGEFPLFSVADYKNTMPEDIAKKGGVFMPMFQKEAMWINFSAKEPFALKIFVGGVNAISGIPINESPEDQLNRLKVSGKAKQDYVVLPEQPWLDGIASEDGKIRQFIAMPKGSGYSVEAQITGEEKIGGLQFELTPVKRRCPERLTIRLSSSASSIPTKAVVLMMKERGLGDDSTIEDLKKVIRDEFDVALQHQSIKLIQSSRGQARPTIGIDNKLTLAEIWMTEDSVIEIRDNAVSGPMQRFSDRTRSSSSSGADDGFVLFDSGSPVQSCLSATSYAKKLSLSPGSIISLDKSGFGAAGRGGSEIRKRQAQASKPIAAVKAMSLAPGGLIKQAINADVYPASIWDTAASILFNVQLLNSESFFAVTGRYPPPSPVDAATYKSHGYPFFDIWNEEVNDIKGDFGGIKSVAMIDEEKAKVNTTITVNSKTFWNQMYGNVVENPKDPKPESHAPFEGEPKFEFPVIMLDPSLRRTFKPLSVLPRG